MLKYLKLKIKVMLNSAKLKLRVLQLVQISLSIGCYATFLTLKEYGLFFAFMSGWILADFLKTLNLKFFKDE
jgi:hypothetical protein